MLCKRLGISAKNNPCADKIGPSMTGRITGHGFKLSTASFTDELPIQQADKPGIHQDIACMRFVGSAIFEVTHSPYRLAFETAGKGLLNI